MMSMSGNEILLKWKSIRSTKLLVLTENFVEHNLDKNISCCLYVVYSMLQMLIIWLGEITTRLTTIGGDCIRSRDFKEIQSVIDK